MYAHKNKFIVVQYIILCANINPVTSEFPLFTHYNRMIFVIVM